MFSGFTDGDTYAVCVHRLVSNPEYDSGHPHNQYVTCTSCGEIIYTGSHLTKPHGDGTGGTCAKCGTHTYNGQSCTNKGICSCGATIAPSGHTLESVQYSDAAHPHAYFQYCIVCHSQVYIGGYATKNHGDGTWGSGTCPDCGTHTYNGQGCTIEGICACGATIPSLGHSLEGVTYSDASHPHAYFEYCTRCTQKVYTGGNAIKNHGDGTFGSGTCPDCGDHVFYQTSSQTAHPHETVFHCDCGESYTLYDLRQLCEVCTGNTTTVSNSVTETLIFRSIDGGDGILIGLSAVLDCTVEYINVYNEPSKNSIIDYGYPPFASLNSGVISTVTCTNMSPDLVAQLYAMSHLEVDYFDATGMLMKTQQMEINSVHNAVSNINFFTLDQKPAYAIASAGFSAQYYYPLFGYDDYSIVHVVTYFE